VSQTGADALVRCLKDHGVGHIFGYPGGQLTPIYDALHREPGIRHILARDEQAAAFMADGYARATGWPGVCLAVCGPGVFNAATALATSFTDSVPVLLITGQVHSGGRGPRSGYYHENDQLAACASFTKHRSRVTNEYAIGMQCHVAITTAVSQRPGPVLLEVPVDVLRENSSSNRAFSPKMEPSPAPAGQELSRLADLMSQWKRPLLLAGGGVITAGAEASLVHLAERLGAPVFITAMGKCSIPSNHPLAAGLPWFQATSDLSNMESFFSQLFHEADGLLAIGCRFTQLATGSWSMPVPKSLAQIDIDPEEIGRHYPVAVGIEGDARNSLTALLARLPQENRAPWAAPGRGEPGRLDGLDLITPLRRALPHDAIIAADVTRLGYQILADFPIYEPRTVLHPAGFVAMGYGIPAAIGAKAAFPQRTVVAVVGDGCFLMSGMELATAVQEKLPIVVILVNDRSLTLIKAIQQRRYESRFLGVDLVNPDFGLFAKSFGVRFWRVYAEPTFETAVREAVACGEPALVEVQLGQSRPPG
jgi:thiamine pyrophosphate-dependent acetolactate synthase large subunit-like protein